MIHSGKTVLSNLGYEEPGSSVDEPEDGDDEQEHPPDPEDEEVFLVEQVVGEDAEVVLSVGVAWR